MHRPGFHERLLQAFIQRHPLAEEEGQRQACLGLTHRGPDQALPALAKPNDGRQERGALPVAQSDHAVEGLDMQQPLDATARQRPSPVVLAGVPGGLAR